MAERRSLDERHDRDVVSLVFGLIFVAIGGGFLLTDVAGADVDPGRVGPVALIAIGLIGLLASLRRR